MVRVVPRTSTRPSCFSVSTISTICPGMPKHIRHLPFKISERYSLLFVPRSFQRGDERHTCVIRDYTDNITRRSQKGQNVSHFTHSLARHLNPLYKQAVQQILCVKCDAFC